MRQLIYFLIITTAISCGQSNHNPNSTLTVDTTEDSLSVTKTFVVKEEYEDEEDLEIQEIIVQHKDFEVRILDYSVLIEPRLSGDTLFLETDIGASLENKEIQIISKEDSESFRVFMAFEQTLTVYLGEQQAEDLNDWRKFGEYVELTESSVNYFTTIEFHGKEKEQELNKDFQKIKTKVLELEGDYITVELDSVTNLKYLPVELWLSRAILKIIRIKSDGTQKVYYIDAISAWGC